MARQTLGPKKTRQIAKETGLPVIAVLVRGDTNHRKDLCLKDGTIVYLYADGTLKPSKFRHGVWPVISKDSIYT